MSVSYSAIKISEDFKLNILKKYKKPSHKPEVLKLVEAINLFVDRWEPQVNKNVGLLTKTNTLSMGGYEMVHIEELSCDCLKIVYTLNKIQKVVWIEDAYFTKYGRRDKSPAHF